MTWFGHQLVDFGSSFNRARLAAIWAQRHGITGQCEEQVFEALIRLVGAGGEKGRKGAQGADRAFEREPVRR